MTNSPQQKPPAGTPDSSRRLWLAIGALFMAMTVYAWAVDFFSVQGERTVYTVDCAGGTWSGAQCSGNLVAGDRYRFRALKVSGEVLFWTAGSSEPSGKFTGCSIMGGRNWSCPTNAEAGRTITLQMMRGRPVPDAWHRTRTFHSVAKVRWLLLRIGISLGDTANE